LLPDIGAAQIWSSSNIEIDLNIDIVCIWYRIERFQFYNIFSDMWLKCALSDRISEIADIIFNVCAYPCLLRIFFAGRILNKLSFNVHEPLNFFSNGQWSLPISFLRNAASEDTSRLLISTFLISPIVAVAPGVIRWRVVQQFYRGNTGKFLL
jgi:hypothetical protein